MRSILLAARPSGALSASDFDIVDDAAPRVPEGAALLEPRYLSLDPGMRSAMRDSDNPRFQVGEVVMGWGLARVVESRTSRFRPGQLVRGRMPWAERTVVAEDAAQLSVVDHPDDIPLSVELGALGLPGLVAYVGMVTLGACAPGQVAFVSSAAGAVGSIAGQIARLHGCTVIGSTRASKLDLLRRLGFDEVFDYRAQDPRAALDLLAPTGIDLHLDNVGGAQLQAAFSRLRDHGTVICCGSTSHYDDDDPESFALRGLRALVTRRLTLRGFNVWDHLDQADAHRREMIDWIRDGKLEDVSTIVEGIERVPETFVGLFAGDHVGKVMVRLSGANEDE